MPIQTTPTVRTIERLVSEVQEWASRVAKVQDQMNHLHPGSEAWSALLPSLGVELDWLEEKSKHAAQAVDEFIDALPADD